MPTSTSWTGTEPNTGFAYVAIVLGHWAACFALRQPEGGDVSVSALREGDRARSLQAGLLALPMACLDRINTLMDEAATLGRLYPGIGQRTAESEPSPISRARPCSMKRYMPFLLAFGAPRRPSSASVRPSRSLGYGCGMRGLRFRGPLKPQLNFLFCGSETVGDHSWTTKPSDNSFLMRRKSCYCSQNIVPMKKFEATYG